MNLSKNNKIPKKGFTLIELLVVIAIIASLGGLSYGPIMRHLNTADIKKAQKVCKDLTGSITSYEQIYDSLPYTGANYPLADANVVTSTPDFLEVLMGDNTTINDKGKKFFTADEAKGTSYGLVYNAGNLVGLADVWGNPYTIRLDYSGDGVIDATEIGTGSSYKAELHVEDAIAASAGKDGGFDDEGDAKSW